MFQFKLCFSQETDVIEAWVKMTTYQISALFNKYFYIASGFCWCTQYNIHPTDCVLQRGIWLTTKEFITFIITHLLYFLFFINLICYFFTPEHQRIECIG